MLQATPAARERVVDTVVSAFRGDPAFRYFFIDEAAFERHAATFVGYLFDERVERGTVWIVDGGAAVAMWDGPQPNGGLPANDHRQLDLPDDTLKRLDRYDAAVEAALPSTPYWYLGIVATHPDCAGRGWGRLSMTAGIGRATADGLPAYLETTHESNVALYQRVGWRVTEATSVDGLPIWVMRYG